MSGKFVLTLAGRLLRADIRVMKFIASAHTWRLNMAFWMIAIALLAAGTLARAEPTVPQSNNPMWSVPAFKSLKKVSSLPTTPSEPYLLNNLDCTVLTYRRTDSSDMTTGCFTETAFGLIDTDTNIVIFNGTDEGVPILPDTPRQRLAPWPKAMDLISLFPSSGGGSYVALYKNPLTALETKRNSLLQVTGKQLTRGPELALKDTYGKPLIINPQTMAFSDGGAWMVAESLSGSFVRINLATMDVKAFASSFSIEGSLGATESRVAVSRDGRYVAIANNSIPLFEIYDLTKCGQITDSVRHENCAAYDYRPYVSQQIEGFKSFRRVKFIKEDLISFEAVSVNSAHNGLYVISPSQNIGSLIDYLAMGDSYTSGEGAFNYLEGTDNATNICHLSVNSYPLLITRDLFGPTSGRSVACSGAVINDAGDARDNYRGQVKNSKTKASLQKDYPEELDDILTNFRPGYISQQNFMNRYQPTVATISIGGNDVGFGDILERCIMPKLSRHTSDNTCFNTYEDRLEVTALIDRTKFKLASLYRQLTRLSPSTKLYALGYPRLAYDKGDCPLNVLLSKSELEFSEELVAYLNNAIRDASSIAGIAYIDISDSLMGHRLCEASGSSVAINGLVAGNDAGPFGHESYHPNAFGHELIEQAILQKTHNFNELLSGDPSTSTSLLNAPKSGRQLYTLVPAQIISKNIHQGTSINIAKDGSSLGLKPFTNYDIRLDEPAGRLIGNVTTNSESAINGPLVIPSDIEKGGHTLHIVGPGETEKPLDIVQVINVADQKPAARFSASVSAHAGYATTTNE